MQFITSSLRETQDVARRLATKLRSGSVLALTGELGAGKTSFVQGLAAGLGVKKNYYVNSPTFTIVNIYEGGRLKLNHFDWYRLGSLAEAMDLGLDEYFDGGGVSVIEWAEKFPNVLPKDVIWIRFEVLGAKKRSIEIEGNL